MMSRVYVYNLSLRVLIYLLPLFSFGICGFLRFGTFTLAIPGRQDYLILLAFTELVWILVTNYSKLSTVADLFWEYTGIRAGLFACFTTLLLQTALLVFLHQLVISRKFLFATNVLLFLLVVAARNFFRLTSASTVWPRKCERLLIVGTDQYAKRYVKLLRRIPFFDCKVEAYMQLPGQAVLVADAPVISATDQLNPKKLNVDEVVVAVPPSSYPNLSIAIERLEDLGKPIRAVFDLGPRLSFGSKLFQAGRLQMMNLAISPVESFAYTVVKRTFDLLAATLGFIILSPVLLAIAALVKLSSPGPVLFRQERIGRHGKSFTLLKFRTMHCSSKTESDTLWTTKNDPRCTVIGAVLRRFSLDELPQLLNVIRGEMSLVGPRPERPYYVAKFGEDFEKYNMRHRCHVGMTGWAQINGLRGDTSISERLQYDLYYMRNWSFGMDLQIIFRTAFVAFTGTNEF
ncbi:MAG TPA: exopolysaccharide biosynthesis polyprenyl glycosylphosphotransferase [Candidatus Sulfotelmatobacter sp.]|nr:exopolysaccharide biosynthesis polyprenyl glycosylphosphotransferase [Candidatus Sulfotelmatobacter sp.]